MLAGGAEIPRGGIAPKRRLLLLAWTLVVRLVR